MSSEVRADGAQAGGGSSDDAARESIRRELDRTHFVEAGAGTGKTTALVGRILELVAGGRARIDEIAGITFTEAAAAELRDRLRGALEQAAAKEAPDRRERLEAALADIESAAISTLHGFARRLLAEHPFEAGLPPKFDVLDDIRSSVAFEERWADFVDASLLGPAGRQPLTRAVLCGVTLDHLRQLALQCNRNWDLVADHPWSAGPGVAVDVTEVLEPIGRAAALSGRCTTPGDQLLNRLEQLAEWADELRVAQSESEVLRLVVEMPATSKRKLGRKENWNGQVDAVRSLLDAAVDASSRLVETVAADALVGLLALIGSWTIEAAADRCREGRLEYHDLLVQARDLLRRRPDVASEVADRYRYLLIDEFQDTDPIQAELAVRIAACGPGAAVPGAAGSGEGDDGWMAFDVEPGRLFFVGDPKQAIYRFRRADIAQYLAVRERYAEHPLQLTRNHRSVPGVVEWVNSVFGLLIGKGDPPAQPAYERLEAIRSPHPGTGPVPPVVLLGGAGGDGEDTGTVRRREGREIAAAVRKVVDQGWPMTDEYRAARWSDVTILVPSRTGLPYLLSGLDEADIRYRLEATSLVYATQEVRDLMAVLRAVDDPTDEIAVVAALRSPLFACGDDDLLEHHAHGGGWDYRASSPLPPGDDHRVAEGLRSLSELHHQRWWCDVSELLQLVVARRRVLELALDTPRPREAWRHLRFVMEDARAYSDAFGGDLRRYLAWVEQQSEDGARASEVVLPENDDDAVRIMTIHAAKGLEFPVVVMAGLGVKAAAPSGPRILWGADGPETVVPGVVRSAGFDLLDQLDARMDRAERYRLLYVAATRARDHLIVSLHRRTGTDCPAAWIEEVAETVPHLWCRDHQGRDGVLGAPSAGGPGEPGSRWGGPGPSGGDRRGSGPVEGSGEPTDLAERQAWVERRGALLEENRVPWAVAATAVAKLVATPVSDDTGDLDAAAGAIAGKPGPDDEEAAQWDQRRASWRRGRSGTAVGRAVHAVLQVVDLATGEGLDGLARAQAVAEGVPDRASEVARLVRAALDSDVVCEAVGSGRFWRELYVGVPLGPRVLEGIVDLLVDGPTGLQVVDYKTDQFAEVDGPRPLLSEYRLQGAAYALALETALGRPVSRCTFLFLRPSGAVGVDVADLGAAMDEVRLAVDRR